MEQILRLYFPDARAREAQMGEWLDEIVDISEEGDTDMRIDSIGALAKDARASARRSHVGRTTSAGFGYGSRLISPLRRRLLLLFHRLRLACRLNRYREGFEREELGLRHAVDLLDRAAEKRGVRVAGGGDLVAVGVVRAWTSTI